MYTKTDSFCSTSETNIAKQLYSNKSKLKLKKKENPSNIFKLVFP